MTLITSRVMIHVPRLMSVCFLGSVALKNLLSSNHIGFGATAPPLLLPPALRDVTCCFWSRDWFATSVGQSLLRVLSSSAEVAALRRAGT